MTIQGGHGLFGESGLVSCNGYERWRMHWKHPNAPHYISAHGHANSDIKKADGNRSFYLRDFVTFGDAIRIQLPYKDSPEASNQYIWLENHQIGRNNKLDFLQFSNIPGRDCRPEGLPGIYAYYQVGRDVLSGPSNVVWFSEERDNLKIISAEGYWNYSFQEVDPYQYRCVNWQLHNYILERLDANPFCGYQDQEKQIHPFPNDSIIKLAHEFPMWRKRIGINDIDSLPSSGDNRDAFSVHSKINMSTNPSTCNAKAYYNLMNDYITNYTAHAHRNNETTYLTGLSIEMIPQSNNTVFVNIRWDDYDITNSANWTGKIALMEKAILKSGNNIHLKQNKTPAQFTRDAESGYFAKTSLFTCEPNSELFQEPNTTFIVDEKSKMLLKSGSKYTISENADLTIKSGCTLEVEDCAILEIKGQLIVETGATIKFHSNAAIIMDTLSHIVYSGNVPVLIYPYVWVAPAPSAITGNVILSQPMVSYSNISINAGATLTVTSSIKVGAKNNIIVHPGGKLVINGGTLTNACPGTMWQGITVMGDSSQPASQNYQGYVQINNGEIENAICGITVHGGGMVEATNAYFTNNLSSV